MTDRKNDQITDDELDELYGSVEFIQVPEQFGRDVLQSIAALPEYNRGVAPAWWQWLALIGGGIPALGQVAAFVFSAWSVVNVG